MVWKGRRDVGQTLPILPELAKSERKILRSRLIGINYTFVLLWAAFGVSY